MAKKEILPTQGAFNWELYSDGYNGRNLRRNKTVESNNKRTVVYSHEEYAENDLDHYTCSLHPGVQETPKDLTKGSLLQIIDVRRGDKTTLLGMTACGGTVEIDMNKERDYLRALKPNLTPARFVQVITESEEARRAFLASKPVVKVLDNLRPSLFEGHCSCVMEKLMGLVGDPDHYCMATVVGITGNGYYVSLNGVVCYMPGACSPADFNSNDAVIGRVIPVFVINYVVGRGFVVSNEKYSEQVLPKLMETDLYVNKRVRCRVTKFTNSKNVAFVVFESDNKEGMFSGLITPDECVSFMYDFLQNRNNEDGVKILREGDEFYGYIHSYYLDDKKKVRVMIGDVPTTNSFYEQKQRELARMRAAAAAFADTEEKETADVAEEGKEE